MKKYFLIVALALLSNSMAFGQYESIGAYKFIFAPNGLRARLLPSLNSEILKVIPHGRFIGFDARTQTQDTIDGITDYWYRTLVLPGAYGWVFGGYLIDKFESEPYLGQWRDADEITWVLGYDRRFHRGTALHGWRWGTFEITTGNKIFFIFDTSDLGETEREFHRREAEMIFSGADDLVLRFDSEEIILVRQYTF